MREVIRRDSRLGGNVSLGYDYSWCSFRRGFRLRAKVPAVGASVSISDFVRTPPITRVREDNFCFALSDTLFESDGLR